MAEPRTYATAQEVLDRALVMFAQAMMAQDDVDAAEEVDRHLGPYPTPLGHPPALPQAPDSGYLDRLERWRDDIVDAVRVVTDEVTGPAAAEVRCLLGDVPQRSDPDGQK